MHPALFDWGQTGLNLLSVAVAYVLALPIGWDWEKIRHSVGLRTFPLVAVASCCYVLIARRVIGSTASFEHIIQGLMTGIGFIGGGAIFKQGPTVHGTATAASIWGVGALGAAVGFGAYDIAVILSLVNLVTVRLLKPLKESLDGAPLDRNGR